MTEWLIEQTLLTSALLALLLLARPVLAKHLSALTHYTLWSCIPLSLAMSAFLGSVELPRNLNKFVVSANQSSQQLIGSVSVSGVLLYLWMSVAVLLTVILLISHCRFSIHQGLWRQRARQIQFSDKTYKVKTSCDYGSPFVIGFFSPVIVLPTRFTHFYNHNQQKLILNHEQVHKVRGDIWWNLVAQLIVILFWFNPLTWLAYRHFRQVQELACDEAVIADQTSSLKAEYANALLCTSTSKELSPHLIHYGDKSMLKDRLTRIMRKPTTKGWKNVIALLMVSCAAITTTVVTAGNSSSEQISAKPLTRVEPFYPPQAVAQNIEGSVTLQYDIKTDGTVTNVKIIDAQPANVFGKNAKAALEQWVYEKPARRLNDMMVQLDFVLSETSSKKRAEAHKSDTEMVLVENHN